LVEKSGALESLKISEFRNFIISRLIITVALQMQSVIVGWQIYEITRDPLSLGLIGIAEAIPAISITLYAGHLVDISDRKKILVRAVYFMILAALMLSVISYDIIEEISRYKVVSIYFVIFVTGLTRGFTAPSSFALMPQLIPEKILPNAISWNTFAWQTGAVTGPAIGGFTVAYFGFDDSYLLIAGLLFLSSLLMLTISKKPVPVPEKMETPLQRVKEGIRFVFSNKIILHSISLDLFAVLFGGAVVLLPVFAGEILEVGAEGLGILRAAPAVGAVVMALALTKLSFVNRNAGFNLIWSVAGFGVSIIVFGLSGNFYLSVFALFMSGLFDSISVVIRSTIIQTMTPENMKGRVSSVNSIFIGSSNEIGAFESGVAAKILGVVPSVIFGGSMTLLITLLTGWKARNLRKLKL